MTRSGFHVVRAGDGTVEISMMDHERCASCSSPLCETTARRFEARVAPQIDASCLVPGQRVGVRLATGAAAAKALLLTLLPGICLAASYLVSGGLGQRAQTAVSAIGLLGGIGLAIVIARRIPESVPTITHLFTRDETRS